MCLGFGLLIMLDSNSSRCAGDRSPTNVETNMTFPQNSASDLPFNSGCGSRRFVPNPSYRPSGCHAPQRYGDEYKRIYPHPYARGYHWYFDWGCHLLVGADQAAEEDTRHWRLPEWAIDRSDKRRRTGFNPNPGVLSQVELSISLVLILGGSQPVSLRNQILHAYAKSVSYIWYGDR